jgi:hypothetical protein
MPTPRQQLASTILRRPVEDYLTEHRDAGMSWRRLAVQLHIDTKGKVDISGEALRQWLPNDRG